MAKPTASLVIHDPRNPSFSEFSAVVQMSLCQAGDAAVLADTCENPALPGRTIATTIEHAISGLLTPLVKGDAGGFPSTGWFGRGVPVRLIIRPSSSSCSEPQPDLLLDFG